jgi:hypothetical protein
MQDRSPLAIASLVVGVLNLCAWIIPICGCPLSIIGIVLGAVSVNSSQRTLAIIGIVLCGLGLVATIANGFLGAGLSIFQQLQSGR